MPIPIIKLTGYVVISEGGGALAQARKHNLSGRNVVELTFSAKQRPQKRNPRRELFRYTIN